MGIEKDNGADPPFPVKDGFSSCTSASQTASLQFLAKLGEYNKHQQKPGLSDSPILYQRKYTIPSTKYLITEFNVQLPIPFSILMQEVGFPLGQGIISQESANA